MRSLENRNIISLNNNKRHSDRRPGETNRSPQPQQRLNPVAGEQKHQFWA